MDESDISELEQTLITTQEAGNSYLQSVLTKFIFRWVLLAFFCLYLWNLCPFPKWISLLLLPFFFYSLYQIYLQKRAFRQKIEDIKALIEEVKNMS